MFNPDGRRPDAVSADPPWSPAGCSSRRWMRSGTDFRDDGRRPVRRDANLPELMPNGRFRQKAVAAETARAEAGMAQ